MSLRFNYKGLLANGKKVKDAISAPSLDAAQEELKRQKITVISIESDSKKQSLFGEHRVTSSHIEQSTSQLATLLENGVKINEAIEVLIDTSTTNALASLWRNVHKNVQAGMSLHHALSEFSDVFDVLYLEMVNIAEQTGTMPEVFRGLSDNLIFQRDLKSKTIQALVYPMIILFVCVVAIFSIFNFVIPNMASVFASAKDLPGYTQWLLDTSEFVSANNGLILFSFMLVAISLVATWNNPKSQKKLHQILSKLPLCSAVILKTEQIRFCSAMTLTLNSGVSLSTALMLSNRTLSIDETRNMLEVVRSKIDAGSSLAKSLSESRVLDKISVSLVKVGEQSGTLNRSFEEVTRRIRSNFESWIVKMTSLLEPLLILVMGAIVGSVVIIMLLSIVSVNDISL